MSPVHVSVGHDDDAVVTQFFDIKVIRTTLAVTGTDLTNACTQGRDEREDFVAGQQLFVSGLLDV